ncbi:MAG: adenosylcobalamin-dependent ribonucleoside-diphosphate reductase [Methylococcaceae bacterium]|nr:adenosylcobalamin-dependent ribonucleoside-diphosphate reductase [Methylococcaceae bacterium]
MTLTPSRSVELPSQPISEEVLLEKYAKGDEQTAEDIFRRVAKALAAVEKDPAYWEERFLYALQSGFIPAGRILSAAGTGIQATLINCFVQPVGDSISEPDENGKPGIYTALAEAAETMRRGGGVGYDFSAIRPKGAFVKGTASRASGPVSYMRVFDRSCETVESAGSRRGAQMGILRCGHPDILEFIHAKDKPGELSNFNISVGVTDEFMRAVSNAECGLRNAEEPIAECGLRNSEVDETAAPPQSSFRNPQSNTPQSPALPQSAIRIPQLNLWDQIMASTYDHAEPGIIFLDRVNAENNLAYCETISATNPCGEQPLPDYGCCCLGSIDLTRFVSRPFTDQTVFGFEAFIQVVGVAVRMLDNVLDVTYWPLEKQRQEAMSKRRIGLGFTGLGDALLMRGLKYDTPQARDFAASLAENLRNEAYRSSAELAEEKGSFPLFDPERFLRTGFSTRLPQDLREDIRRRGLRNSHLLSIAPTGTISLAFADNASNGIEPASSWEYTRRKRQADGTVKEYRVEDHAHRLYREQGGDVENLPEQWVTALEISAMDHMRMLQAVQPYIDSSISKTVNVPAVYPFEDFKNLYLEAWKAGLKGLATYRPNAVTGQVLVAEPVKPETTGARPDFDESDPDRRLRLEKIPEPALASLRWRRRPRPTGGNPAWCYFVEHSLGAFAVFVGHMEDGGRHPFEVWVNGAEQPRGLGALAKSLSMDMRSNDHGWLETKLKSLIKAQGDDGFMLSMPPEGELLQVPSLVSGFARLVHYRCQELGVFKRVGETPVLDALMSPKEPKTGTNGTLSWTVDIHNPATLDDFVMGLKELTLPNGQRRPYSVWLSGEYPKVLDGLCKSLSYDMRVVDPAWVGAKLRQLLDFPEPRGDFLAWVPGEKRKISYPSTIAYLCRLMLHRYSMLGILDEEGFPLDEMGVMVAYEADNVISLKSRSVGAMETRPGKRCLECGNYAVIRKDGCDFCTACGATGACG